jgi:hypothetical protein
LAAAVAFGRRHAVDAAIGARGHAPHGAGGERLELPNRDRVEAAIAAHVVAAIAAVEDGEGAVVEQAIPLEDRDELSAGKPHQPTVIRADPQRAVAVFVKRADAIAGQAIRGCPRLHLIAGHSREAAVCAGPDCAVAGFTKHLDVLEWQGWDFGPRRGRRSQEPDSRRKPYDAAPIAQEVGDVTHRAREELFKSSIGPDAIQP